VLLDIMMPEPENMDSEKVEHGRETGVELARRFKARKPDVPIVALTVVRDPEIVARMNDAGIRRIVIKPADADAVAQALLWEIKNR
jgi:DNA-binding NarL/FixJ family response regulator